VTLWELSASLRAPPQAPGCDGSSAGGGPSVSSVGGAGADSDGSDSETRAEGGGSGDGNGRSGAAASAPALALAFRPFGAAAGGSSSSSVPGSSPHWRQQCRDGPSDASSFTTALSWCPHPHPFSAGGCHVGAGADDSSEDDGSDCDSEAEGAEGAEGEDCEDGGGGGAGGGADVGIARVRGRPRRGGGSPRLQLLLAVGGSDGRVVLGTVTVRSARAVAGAGGGGAGSGGHRYRYQWQPLRSLCGGAGELRLGAEVDLRRVTSLVFFQAGADGSAPDPDADDGADGGRGATGWVGGGGADELLCVAVAKVGAKLRDCATARV
jgi:hypothetical protein